MRGSAVGQSTCRDLVKSSLPECPRGIANLRLLVEALVATGPHAQTWRTREGAAPSERVRSGKVSPQMFSLRRCSILVLLAIIAGSYLSKTNVSVAAPDARATTVNAPEVTVKRYKNGYVISWSEVPGAIGYAVWRRSPIGSDANQGYVITGTKWESVDSSVPASQRTMRVLASSVGYQTHAFFRSPEWGVSAVGRGGSSAISSARAGCATAYFVSARGSGQNPSRTRYAFGLGSYGDTVYQATMTRLGLGKGSFQANAVNYPARNVAWVGQADPEQYATSRDAGTSAARSNILSIINNCPKSKLFLFGFSQGADAIGDAIFSLSSQQMQRIIHIQLLADPSRNVRDEGFRFLPSERTENGWYGPRAAIITESDAFQVEEWCGSDDDICSRSGPASVPNHIDYTCHVQWIAQSNAARAKAVGWKPNADSSHPSCVMPY